MNRKIVPLAAVVTIVAGCGGAATYMSLASDECWTAGCRAERAQRENAAIAAAISRTRAAWADVGNLVEQQVDIGTAITSSAQEQLAAADARTDAQLGRIDFVTSGINPLSNLARPFVDEASDLGRARGARRAGFTDSTQPIIRAIGNARLTVRKTMPPTTASAVNDFVGAVADLQRGSLASLAPLHDQGLIGAARANELSHSVRANANALRLAIAAYDQDARELAALDGGRATHAHDLPIGLNPSQEKGLASLGRDAATTFIDRPPPVQAAGPSPRDLAEQHAGLSMSADIERMNAETRALGIEADRTLAEGQGGSPPAPQHQPIAPPIPIGNTI